MRFNIAFKDNIIVEVEAKTLKEFNEFGLHLVYHKDHNGLFIISEFNTGYQIMKGLKLKNTRTTLYNRLYDRSSMIDTIKKYIKDSPTINNI